MRVMNGSLQERIMQRLAEAPDAPCLAFYGRERELRWRSREAVHRGAATLARRLRDDGLNVGDVCVIVLPSGEAAATMLLAVLLLGGVPLLVAPPALIGGNRDIAKTLRTAVRRTRARLAVCSSSLEGDVPDVQRSIRSTRLLLLSEQWRSDFKEASITPALPRSDDVAAMQLTSGTTSMPRICVWDHGAILSSVDGMASAMGLSPNDVCLNWTPLYHDMGLVNNFLLCLLSGTPLVLLSPQEFIRRPVLWLQALSDAEATMTWSPNFGFAVTARKVQDSDLAGVRLGRVRAFWNAAERIHRETFDAFYRRFAVIGVRRDALKTNYGCAEAIGGATFGALGQPALHETIDRRLLDLHGIARPVPDEATGIETVSIVSAGRPHQGVALRILSKRGRVLPDGHVGEICLETGPRMLRYHRNVRDTQRALRRGLLHTGDLGYVRGGELFWVGRTKERITTHGRKFDPSAFEELLASTPGLREGCFVAFGVPDEYLGTERLILVSEVRSPLGIEKERIVSTIRGKCFLHMGIAPDEVVLVQSGTLAKTSSGKRRHRHFRTRYLMDRLRDIRLSDIVAHP
jgi:fatty-acyl-CoA synthase